MTTTRTPFVPFRAAFALALLPMMTSGAAAQPQEGPRPSSRIVRLPPESEPGAEGPEENFSGVHLRWRDDERDAGVLDLGPAVPTRTLISVIEQRIDADGGRDAGISVENLGSVLLIRAGAGRTDALDRAAATAKSTIQEFEALARTLSFQASVTLTASGEGEADAIVFQESRPIAAGRRVALGERAARLFVADFNVEIATGEAIADPVIAQVESGETLHLWASTTIRPDGRRALYVQGLLDIATETTQRTFDPGIYDLGVLEQPSLQSVQVMFAGVVPADGPLVVTLDGASGERSKRRLEISAEPLLAATDAPDSRADSQRVVDLSRGMWRSSLQAHHALSDPGTGWQLPESRMPASAAQLLALMYGRERIPRPELGSSALFLDGSGPPARSRTIQTLFESVDPTGPTMLMEVASTKDNLTVSMPVAMGAMLRVARTMETVLLTDYDPQVANEATLSDPSSDFAVYGAAAECVLGLRNGVPCLLGSASRRTLSALEVREVDPTDVGRIQHPTTLSSSANFVIPSGSQATAAGLEISLKNQPE